MNETFKLLARVILRILGWKIEANTIKPLTEKKYILIVAPHTSALDFIIGKLAYVAMGLKSFFFIKKEFFIGPLGHILRYLGGVSIDRSNPREAVKTMLQIKEAEEFRLIITPEGTRKATSRWNSGFYKIAQRTKIPVFIGILDYQRKYCILDSEFVISGDFNADMAQLDGVCNAKQAKNPECFACHRGV